MPVSLTGGCRNLQGEVQGPPGVWCRQIQQNWSRAVQILVPPALYIGPRPQKKGRTDPLFFDSSGVVLFMILNAFSKKRKFLVGYLKIKSSATASGDSSQCLGSCGGDDHCLPLSLDETNVPSVCAHSRGAYMLGKHREAWRRAHHGIQRARLSSA